MTVPSEPAPADRAEAQVRAAVRAAAALTRREPTPSERAAFKTSLIVYGSIVGAGVALTLLVLLSASWGPPAPPPMPRT